jgi:hypothetical protein
LVADLSLDKHMLEEVIAKNSEGGTQAADHALADGELCGQWTTGVPSDAFFPRKFLLHACGAR